MPFRMASIQRLTTPNAGKDVNQQELSFLGSGDANGRATLADSLQVS